MALDREMQTAKPHCERWARAQKRPTSLAASTQKTTSVRKVIAWSTHRNRLDQSEKMLNVIHHDPQLPEETHPALRVRAAMAVRSTAKKARRGLSFQKSWAMLTGWQTPAVRLWVWTMSITQQVQRHPLRLASSVGWHSRDNVMHSGRTRCRPVHRSDAWS